MKSDLIRQALQRYTDKATLRQRPIQTRAIIATIGAAAAPTKSDDDYKDRLDKYNTKVHKSRTLILDNCNSQIAEQYVEAYDTAEVLQTYLERQFSKQGISQEYLIYLEQAQLQYNRRDLEKFYELYCSKLLKVNQIPNFKVSDKYGLFNFLSLIGEYFP